MYILKSPLNKKDDLSKYTPINSLVHSTRSAHYYHVVGVRFNCVYIERDVNNKTNAMAHLLATTNEVYQIDY